MNAADFPRADTERCPSRGSVVAARGLSDRVSTGPAGRGVELSVGAGAVRAGTHRCIGWTSRAV